MENKRVSLKIFLVFLFLSLSICSLSGQDYEIHLWVESVNPSYSYVDLRWTVDPPPNYYMVFWVCKELDDWGWDDSWARLDYTVRSYRDSRIVPNHNFRYRIHLCLSTGAFYGSSNVVSIYTSISEERLSVPELFLEISPNPSSNNEVTISYSLPESQEISFKIYDILGKEERILFNGTQEAGHHRIIWNKKDKNSQDVPVGIHFVVMEGKDCLIKVKKIVLTK